VITVPAQQRGSRVDTAVEWHLLGKPGGSH
jgi:hypothetical protein